MQRHACIRYQTPAIEQQIKPGLPWLVGTTHVGPGHSQHYLKQPRRFKHRRQEPRQQSGWLTNTCTPLTVCMLEPIHALIHRIQRKKQAPLRPTLVVSPMWMPSTFSMVSWMCWAPCSLRVHTYWVHCQAFAMIHRMNGYRGAKKQAGSLGATRNDGQCSGEC